MEARAKLRNVRMGARRARLVADLVRRRPCSEALDILGSTPKRAARLMEKLIRSALSNAEELNSRRQAGIDLDNLYVKTITVDEGQRIWRMRPRAHGRAYWICKATAQFSVVLDER